MDQRPNLADYIFLPEKGIYVAKRARPFGCDFATAVECAQEDGGKILTLPEVIDFINLMQSRKNVYDGNGKRLSRKEKEDVDAVLTRSTIPWRYERFDARFEKIGNVFVIHYNHRFANGKVRPLNTEPLEDCLMQSRSIRLEGWLKNHTGQGLPRKDTPCHDHPHAYYLAYNPPRDESIAIFSAYSDWKGILSFSGRTQADRDIDVRLALDEELVKSLRVEAARKTFILSF